MNSEPRLQIDLEEFNRRTQLLIEKHERSEMTIDDLLRFKLGLNRLARGLKE